jgi:hypothetical protein
MTVMHKTGEAFNQRTCGALCMPDLSPIPFPYQPVFLDTGMRLAAHTFWKKLRPQRSSIF